MNTFKGVSTIVLCAAILGLLAGLALAGSDLANPWTSQAQAAQIEMQTVYNAKKKEVDLIYYRREREETAQAQIAKTNDDIVYHRQMNQVKLNLLDWAGKAVIGFAVYAAILGGFLIFWHRFHQIMANKEAASRPQPRLTQAYLRPTNGAAHNGNGNGRPPRHHPSLHPHIPIKDAAII